MDSCGNKFGMTNGAKIAPGLVILKNKKSDTT